MSWRSVLLSVMDFYERADREAPGVALLTTAFAELAALRDCDPHPLPAIRKAVARYVPIPEDATAPAPVRRIVEAFNVCAAEADWQQNPNYTAATMGVNFVDNYGYIEPVGPGRRYACPHLRIGFLVLGPGVHYPDHVHPAEEVYHPIAGQALWWREGTDWSPVPLGAPVHHAPWVRHAMRTEAEPLVALYCWGGEIGPAARLTAGSHERPM